MADLGACLGPRPVRRKGVAGGGSYAFGRWVSAGLRRRNREQAGDAAAADVVDAGKHHVVALDLHQHRRGQAFAVEFAERHGEIGGMTVPADGEIRTERDLRGPLWTAHGDLPFTAAR